MKNKSITVCTVLVENSPQALPLGAACIASSIKTLSSDFIDLKVNLVDFNLEQKLSVEQVTNILLSQNSFIYCFSIFVWNKELLSEVVKNLKKTDCICIAGGPEVTANPKSFLDFDFVISGEGEVVTKNLIKRILNNDLPAEKIFYGKRAALENLTSPYLDKTLNPKKYDGALWNLQEVVLLNVLIVMNQKVIKKLNIFLLIE